MDTFVNVIHILLALLFTSGGFFKLVLPYDRFIKFPAQAWANDFKPEHIKLIGIVELAAAVGLFVSLFVPSLRTLTPFAAVGGALVMAGAMATHLRRTEYVNMVGNFVWLGFALIVTYDRLIGIAV